MISYHLTPWQMHTNRLLLWVQRVCVPSMSWQCKQYYEHKTVKDYCLQLKLQIVLINLISLLTSLQNSLNNRRAMNMSCLSTLKGAYTQEYSSRAVQAHRPHCVRRLLVVFFIFKHGYYTRLYCGKITSIFRHVF
jgi:hypothetical protein